MTAYLMASIKDEWIENCANEKTPFFFISKAIIISKENTKLVKLNMIIVDNTKRFNLTLFT